MNSIKKIKEDGDGGGGGDMGGGDMGTTDTGIDTADAYGNNDHLSITGILSPTNFSLPFRIGEIKKRLLSKYEIKKPKKIKEDEEKSSKKVFLGGTCAKSNWRKYFEDNLKISYFNPVVKDWNEEAQKQEILERENCDFCLYVITPKMTGVYSIAEVVQDSNKRPEKTIFCFITEDEKAIFDKHQIKSLNATSALVELNGAKWFKTLEEVLNYLNSSND